MAGQFPITALIRHLPGKRETCFDDTMLKGFVGFTGLVAPVGVSIAVPPQGSSESTWSPFQSAEVREICAHLSPTEHALLMEDARERGRKIGYWFALPLAFVAVLLFSSWRIGLALGALFVVYFVVGVLPRFRAMRRRSIELLCETEWARTRNYTPTNLKLMTFPWS